MQIPIQPILQWIIASGLIVFAVEAISRAYNDWKYRKKLKELLGHELRGNLKTVNENLALIDKYGYAYFLRRGVYESILMTGNLSRFGKDVYEPLFDAYSSGEATRLILQGPTIPPEDLERTKRILKRQNEDCRHDILDVLKRLGVTLSPSEQRQRLDTVEI